jgi:hypothetical protein
MRRDPDHRHNHSPPARPCSLNHEEVLAMIREAIETAGFVLLALVIVGCAIAFGEHP